MLLHMLQMICCLREAELLSSEVTIKATVLVCIFIKNASKNSHQH